MKTIFDVEDAVGAAARKELERAAIQDEPRRRREAAKDRAEIRARGQPTRRVLTEAQRAKLRALGRQAFDFEMQSRARSAIIDTHCQFRQSCQGQLARLEPELEHARRMEARTRTRENNGRYVAELEELEARRDRLQADIKETVADIDRVYQEAQEAAAISTPMRRTIEKVLAHVGLSPADVGINFGLLEDRHRVADIVVGHD